MCVCVCVFVHTCDNGVFVLACTLKFPTGADSRASCCACVRACERARSCLRCVDIETSTESRRGHRDPPTHGSCGRSQMFIKHKLNQELPPEHTLYTEGDEWRRKEKAEEGEDALCDAVFTCL